MKLFALVCFLFAASVSAHAQTTTPASQAVPDILKNLGGCFTVHYQFFEDGKNDYDLSGVYERIVLTDDNGVYKAQHYGVQQDHTLMKHFREEWSSADGQIWKQKIVGPFEDPRYSCSAPFKFNQWRCTVKGAPKPFRDAERKDYDFLDRDNTVQITPNGFVQNEVNLKKTTTGQEVATEVGWVIYTHVTDNLCPAAPVGSAAP